MQDTGKSLTGSSEDQRCQGRSHKAEPAKPGIRLLGSPYIRSTGKFGVLHSDPSTSCLSPQETSPCPACPPSQSAGSLAPHQIPAACQPGWAVPPTLLPILPHCRGVFLPRPSSSEAPSPPWGRLGQTRPLRCNPALQKPLSNTMLFIECLLCTRPWVQHFAPVLSFCSPFSLAAATPQPWEEAVKSCPSSTQNPTCPLAHPHTTFQLLSYLLLSLQLTTASPHWPPCRSLNRGSIVSPQGLCTCSSHFPQISPWFLPYLSQVFP